MTRRNEDGEEKEDRATDLVGPVRRNSSLRRNTLRDSVISTASIDSEDCMLDYETSVDLGPEGVTEEMSESVTSIKSWRRGSTQRNKNRNSTTSDGPSRSHRHSMDVSLDELKEMRNSLSGDQGTTGKEG